MVQSRLSSHLVETDAERLGGIEGADDHILGETRKPAALLLVDGLTIPAHEHMFAQEADGRGFSAIAATLPGAIPGQAAGSQVRSNATLTQAAQRAKRTVPKLFTTPPGSKAPEVARTVKLSITS